MVAGVTCLVGVPLVASLGGDRAAGRPRGTIPESAGDAFDVVPEPRLGTVARVRGGYAVTVAGLQIALRNRRVMLVLLLMLGLFMCRGAPGTQWTVHFAGITGGSLIALAVARGLGDALQVPLLLRTARLREGSPARRTKNIVLFAVVAGAALAASALVYDGYLGLALFTVWGLAWGLCMPGLKAALNEQLASSSRATVLSFGSLLNSLGTGAVLVAVSLSGVALGSVGITWVASGVAAAVVGLAGGVVAYRSARAAQAAEAAAKGVPGT